MRRLVWGAAAAVATAVLVLVLAGWRPVVLLSDSMAPAAPAGSLLVTRPVAPTAVDVGDVVTVQVDGPGRVTHRVVAIEELDGTIWVRLQGDANDVPDPGRVALSDDSLRTVLVVPGLGRLLTGNSLLLLAGTGLLLLGGAGLVAVGRRTPPAVPARPQPDRTGASSRVTALMATLEALAADGMDPATLAALARVRTGALFGVEPVEQAPEAAGLDDGARFVLVGLADADPAALAVVPPTSERAVSARTAVAAWWTRVAPRIPPAIRSELTTVVAAAGQRGGIAGSRPVD